MRITLWLAPLLALGATGVLQAQGARLDCADPPEGCDPVEPGGGVSIPPALDAWSDLYTFTSADGAWWLTPIHATLMPNEEILFFGLRRDEECPGAYACQPPFAWERFAWTMPALKTPSQPYVSPTSCYPEGLTMGQFVVVDDIYDNHRPFLPIGHDLFCSGHTLLADGNVFTAGGTFFPSTPCPIGVCGLTYGTIYNRHSGRLKHTDNMAGVPDYCPPLPCGSCEDPLGGCPTCPRGSGYFNTAMRWYPTCTRLPDERILITGGLTQTYLGVAEGLQNNSIEVYDPESGEYELLLPSRRDDVQQNWLINRDYTHVTVLPDEVVRGGFGYELLMFGQHGVPLLFDLDGTNPIPLLASTAPGCRPDSICPDLNCDFCSGVGVASTVLPIRAQQGEWGYSNGSVLLAGGAHDTSHQRSFDVYDPVQDSWIFKGSRRAMDTGRHHPSTVILPTGEILVVGGHNLEVDGEDLEHALYLDPRAGFRATRGISNMGQPGGHGYHAVSLLLPDGRVLVAGGRDQERDRFFTERPTFEYLYPPYMSKKRMRLLVVNDVLEHGETYDLFTDKEVREVVLIGLGSMTHSFDMNQRYVQLQVLKLAPRNPSNPNKLYSQILIPDSRSVLPPGHYMLFALDAQLVPSRGRIVHVAR